MSERVFKCCLVMARFGSPQLSAWLSILCVSAHDGVSERLVLQAAGNEDGKEAGDFCADDGQKADSSETDEQPPEK